MRNFFFILVLLGCSFKTNAQTTLAWYGFDSSNPNPTSVNSSLVSASSITIAGGPIISGYGNGVTNSPDLAIVTKNWPNDPVAIDVNQYLELTVTANSGKTIQLTKIKVWEKVSGGFCTLSIRSTYDAYTSDLYQNGSDDPYWQYHAIATPPIVISDGGSISFRFYGGNTGNSSTRLALDSLFIEGTDLTTLPIELSLFEVNNVSDGVKVDWTTATEHDNDHFVVERSDDARNFQVVEEVDGAGNSQQMLHYSIIDRDVTNGWYYYRLSQVDHDGQSEVFTDNVVPIYVTGSEKLIYPNPAKVGEVVHFPRNSRIVDPLGRLVHSGVDSFTPTSSGVYIVGARRLVVK